LPCYPCRTETPQVLDTTVRDDNSRQDKAQPTKISTILSIKYI
jgi:hypothetical protein